MIRIIFLLAIWPGNRVFAGINQAVEKTSVGIPTVDYFQWSGGLVLILVLIFCLLWMLRKIGGIRTMSGGQLQVLGGVALGARERAVLLKVGRKHLLVGVSAGRVQTLCELSDDDLIEASGQDDIETEQGVFKERLRQVLGN